jgi:threonine dehydrogenase-like Zn-dependent dehydrogenase
MDMSLPIVLGHEYVAEVVDYGPDTVRSIPRGAHVTSQPLIDDPAGTEFIGISNRYPGGFGELMVLAEDRLRLISKHVEPDVAAMAEPLAVGFSYVRQARLGKKDVPLVVGCGAIGLAMVLALKLTDSRPIVASDFSARRRQMALEMGADFVVDPRQSSPYRAPAAAPGRTPNVIFECVGIPGVMDQIMRGCGSGARIIVPGWCLEPDHMLTVCAHTKGLNVQYGGGPLSEDFDAAVRALVEGTVNPASWIGGRIGLRGVATALEGVGDARNPIRIVVDPRLA